MPSISCPYCHYTIVLKGVRAGSFRPACPECGAQFQLVISADAKVAPEVIALEAIPSSSSASAAGTVAVGSATATVAPAANATVAAPPRKTTAGPPPAGAGSGAGMETQPARRPSDGKVEVGLADQTVKDLARGPVTPAWQAAAGYMRLGGYDVIKKLGEGGMGAVYLANQTSLDRKVALKVLNPRLAADSQFIARFTREAFAAAQLTHHNVVQIHDMGVERTKDEVETNFFSMEFVPGHTLGALVAQQGKLDPEVAVGYVLQAARGLKFAHEHGLIHRDVKPDNLLLNTQGVLKVADLGLVKRAGVVDPAITTPPDAALAKVAESDKTLPSAVMGTPAYMPPEQARDAGTVDARADVYSLGCTLYHLITGRAPFGGRDVHAIIAAHANEVVIPPDRVVKTIPPALSQIVVKMMAKRPDDRYANMGEVVTALEHWLGLESDKPFAPKQDNLRLLEMSAERFNGSTWKTVRTWSFRGFFALCAAGVVVLALPAVGEPLWAAATLGFCLMTVVFYQLLYGAARRTFLMGKVRQLVRGSSWTDWLTAAVVALLGAGLLYAFGLHWVWLGASVAALGVAMVFYAVVDRALAKDREVSLQQTEQMLRSLRLQAIDENTIRHFVCKYCGRDWEEFYEALFGFESKMQARSAWNRGELGRSRPRFGAWREPIIDFIDHHTEAQREEQQRKMLVRVEVDALRAAGVDAYEANVRARQGAQRLMDNAAAVRTVALKRSTELRAPSAEDQGPRRLAPVAAESIPHDWMYEGTQYKARRRSHGSYLRRRYGTPLDIAFGRGVRLVASMLLLTGFGIWWSANGARHARNNAARLVQAREDVTLSAVEDKAVQAIKVRRVFNFSDTGEKPLRIGTLPTWLCDDIGCWNGGIAGALLLFSVFFGGRVFGAATLVSSALGLLGRHLPLEMMTTYEWLPPASAVTLWLIAVVFLRDASED